MGPLTKWRAEARAKGKATVGRVANVVEIPGSVLRACEIGSVPAHISTLVRRWQPLQFRHSPRPSCFDARRISSRARAPAVSGFQGLALRRCGMIARLAARREASWQGRVSQVSPGVLEPVAHPLATRP